MSQVLHLPQRPAIPAWAKWISGYSETSVAAGTMFDTDLILRDSGLEDEPQDKKMGKCSQHFLESCLERDR
ncbi:hypothetical protein CVT26_003308 [Gymnopilus dilepis]|uniref:Uncharacterized protein n=1 Tax=Gymnopilus dilepis TaxID=231916 RepID=A0A409Y541_9AGAR|nr:hypothetical protein CVT26_003308 [Gymnopilus dilepis]